MRTTTDGVVYVVSEWVTASSLADLIADRPLTAGHACELATEVANALEAAHREGLSHLCLTPEHVLRTSHGQIKVAGLAVDAAVRGLVAVERCRCRHARYAGGGCHPLRRADRPMAGRGALGRDRSALRRRPAYAARGRCGPACPWTSTALRHRDARHGTARHRHVGDPVRRPAELAPAPARRRPRRAASRWSNRAAVCTATTPRRRTRGPYLSPYDDEAPPTGGGWSARLSLLVGLVLLVGLGAGRLAAVQLELRGADRTVRRRDADERVAHPRRGRSRRGDKIASSGVTGFDPAEGDGEENTDRAARARRRRRSTVWNTNIYDEPFGPAGSRRASGWCSTSARARRSSGP